MTKRQPEIPAVKMDKDAHKIGTVIVTPEMAVQLLEVNKNNRPLSDGHVQRIAKQIRDGKWKFNGDTIKISDDGEVLDGQHRLWAIIEAKQDVETLIVYGIKRDAFSTIDNIRKLRVGGDVLALNGATRYRAMLSSACMWLIRYQRKIIQTYKAPQNRIENSDIEETFLAHPSMVVAVEKVMPLRSICAPSLLAFIYYILTNRYPEVADRMLETFESPAGISINDPFFRLRAYLMSTSRMTRREPIMVIALAFKAANAAAKQEHIKGLSWRNQGKNPEPFPILGLEKVKAVKVAKAS